MAHRELQSRLDFAKIHQKERDLLRKLKPVVRAALGPALDRFYGVVRSTPEAARFFGSDASQARAQEAQKRHWETLFDGSFDDQYMQQVRRIGSTHARIGLEPKWYLAGYGLVIESMLHAIEAAYSPLKRTLSFGKLPNRADAASALLKAALLDAELSISMYIDEAQVAQRRGEAEREAAVEAISVALRQLADGDLTAELPALPESYRLLSDSFAATMGRLRETIGSVSSAANTINVAGSEIGAASADLAKRTEQQAASLEHTAASMEQVTRSVVQSAKDAGEADGVALDAASQVDEGQRIVGMAVDSMGNIESTSQQIGRIIGVIDDIALQTNLLALNAGVEAARAGEAGRGFAVVATEVRSLAQRSANAAREIKMLIDSSSKQVEQGVKAVAQTGESFQRIRSLVGTVAERVGRIARVSNEQAVELEDINRSISDLDKLTQQNAAMVEETSAAARSLSSEAEGMTQQVAAFRLGDAAGPAVRSARMVERSRRPALQVAAGGGRPAVAAAGGDDWTEF